MELKWLEDFVMLANTASFSRAADARNVTQSAFSRRIKQLETWLETPLISRATIPAELTPEGKLFLPVAQELIKTFYATRQSLRPAGDGPKQSLNLAALHTLTVTRLPGWLARIDEILPQLHTRIIPDKGGIEANLDALVSGEADLLLTYAHPYVPMLLDQTQFDWVVLGYEDILPVIAPDLRQQEWTSPREHDDYLGSASRTGFEVPYLDYGLSSFFGTALRKLFSDRSFARNIVHENTISAGLRELALQGWGLCWLPRSLVDEDLQRGTLVLGSPDGEWHMRAEIRLLRHRREDRSERDDFWEVISAALQVSEIVTP